MILIHTKREARDLIKAATTQADLILIHTKREARDETGGANTTGNTTF